MMPVKTDEPRAEEERRTCFMSMLMAAVYS
jgi:hypothetical protein